MNKVELLIAEEGFKILENIIVDLANRFLHSSKEHVDVMNTVKNVKSSLREHTEQ